MESNEQTEPASKIETDSQIERRMCEGAGRGRGIKQKKGIKEKELMDMDNSVVIVVDGTKGYRGNKW